MASSRKNKKEFIGLDDLCFEGHLYRENAKNRKTLKEIADMTEKFKKQVNVSPYDRLFADRHLESLKKVMR